MEIKKELQEKEDLTAAREKIEESMVLTTLDAMPHLREIIKKGNITADELPYVRTVLQMMRYTTPTIKSRESEQKPDETDEEYFQNILKVAAKK